MVPYNPLELLNKFTVISLPTRKNYAMDQGIYFLMKTIRKRQVCNGPRVVKFISALRKQFLVKNVI